MLDKLSVTAEMSTAKCSNRGVEMGWGDGKQGEEIGVNENIREKGVVDAVCVATLLFCMNGSVEKGAVSNKTGYPK